MEPFPIGQYEEVGFLGKGAFGSVSLWRKKDCFDITNARPEYVALKCVSHPKDHEKEKMRRRELCILDTIQRGDVKNLIKYYGSFEEETLTCKVTNLAMQACHGDLTELIKCQRHLSMDELREIGKQLLTGLDFLHGSEDSESADAERIIHRDLKPDNTLIYVFGCTPGVKPDWEKLLVSAEAMLIKIADFGLGRQLNVQEVSKEDQTVVGTPLYMAPEVKSGTYGVKADIWSFGIIMHELATKERPDFGMNITMST